MMAGQSSRGRSRSRSGPHPVNASAPGDVRSQQRAWARRLHVGISGSPDGLQAEAARLASPCGGCEPSSAPSSSPSGPTPGCRSSSSCATSRWPPRDRLAFVPCMAPFILDFGDLNRHVHARRIVVGPAPGAGQPAHLRGRPPLALVPRGPRPARLRPRPTDRPTPCATCTASARRVNRLLAGKLAHLLYDATPTERLVIIEAIEETGNVLFALTAELARRIEQDEGVELRYLGDFHLALESGHAQHGDGSPLAGRDRAGRRGTGTVHVARRPCVHAVRGVGR